MAKRRKGVRIMPMDEVIRAIERTDVENLQDVLQALLDRYRELYPQWRFLFLSADTKATDATSELMLEIIQQAEERILSN